MRNDPEDSESKLGLDRNRTVVEKLYRTLVLLLLAGFFGIFTALVVSRVTDPWAKFAAENRPTLATATIARMARTRPTPITATRAPDELG